MPAVREPYAVLGLGTSATHAEIRRAYRRRLCDTHPDLAGGASDSEELQAVIAAYRILGNPTRRQLYDQERLRLAAALMVGPAACGPFVGERANGDRTGEPDGRR